MKGSKVQIALADKNKTIRSALRLLVEMETNLHVAGEAEDGCGLLEIIATVKPEVLLVDWDLPGIDALLDRGNGHERDCGSATDSRIIVMANDCRARRRALEAGADYFVCKGDPPESLLSAINAAVASCSTDIVKPGGADAHAHTDE